MDKIKIEIKDIQDTIKQLEEFGIEVIRPLSKNERIEGLQKEIDRIILPDKPPSDEELLKWAKENHEYYRKLKHINDLNAEIKLIEDE